MSHFRLWAALASLGLSTISVMADGVCVPTCADTIQNTHFKELGCSAANEAGCLCVSQGFVDLVAECSVRSCAANVDEIRQGIAVSLNKPTRGKHATTFVIFDCITIANVGIAKPYIDACIHSFCIVHVNGLNNFKYSKYFGRHSDPSHKQHNICEFGIVIRSQIYLLNDNKSGATTSGRSSTSTSVASETSSASSPVPSSGITSGAAAGIGIGVAIVVVAVAVIAFCLLRNRKKQAAPRHSIEISKPLPGSGPTYPTRDDRERDRDSYDKFGHDIEMTSHRYEDMIPSQQPRNMV
ncbi:hypothetical protein MY10362_003509 [Beauveria mimosiformis]